jgi:hypothetical protein
MWQDEDVVTARPGLAAEVERLCAGGDVAGALVALARAVEALQGDSHPPQEIAPRVEAVLHDWGYRRRD